MLAIPFTFRSQILIKYSTDIYVYISKILFRKYAIEGITEVKKKVLFILLKQKLKNV